MKIAAPNFTGMKNSAMAPPAVLIGDQQPPDRFQRSLESAAKDNHAALADAASQLVSSAFVVPVLSSLHDSPFKLKEGPFAAGTAEKRFAPLLDQQLADRITKAANFPLVRSIIDRFTKKDHGGGDHADPERLLRA